MVKLFFDVLHGLKIDGIFFITALEFAIFIGYDGQLKQNSDLEMELFASVIEQLKKTKMTKIENALVWLYVKSWNTFGQHVLDEEELWSFGGDDLEAALIRLAYQRKNENQDLIAQLSNLIMGRFDNRVQDFFEWSRDIHNEVST